MISVLILFVVMVLVLSLVKTAHDVFVMRTHSNKGLLNGISGEKSWRRDSYVAWDYGLRQAEKRMLQLINMQRNNNPRESRNARPLVWSDELAVVARRHSMDQAVRDFCGHYSPEGEDAVARLKKARVPFTTVAENVARGYPSIEATMAAFMDYEKYKQHTHRSNILSSEVTLAGIGIVPDPRGGIIVTQLLAS
jgi:uncharacterized protein YkwD